MYTTASVADLSAASLGALRNLARKKAGNQVSWIAIAGARELTRLGYAIRNRSGWQITGSGADLIAEAPAVAIPPRQASIIPFHPR